MQISIQINASNIESFLNIVYFTIKIFKNNVRELSRGYNQHPWVILGFGGNQEQTIKKEFIN